MRGGMMDNYEDRLVTLRFMKKLRIIIEIFLNAIWLA